MTAAHANITSATGRARGGWSTLRRYSFPTFDRAFAAEAALRNMRRGPSSRVDCMVEEPCRLERWGATRGGTLPKSVEFIDNNLIQW